MAALGILGLTRRLAANLPCSYVQPVVKALLEGRLGYGASILTPRLTVDEAYKCDHADIQKIMNECARIIVGVSRKDKKRSEWVLQKAGLISFNHLIVRAVCLEAWKQVNYFLSDPNPLSSLICILEPSSKVTRGKADGKLTPPLKTRAEVFAWEAYRVWNCFPNLREASSLGVAKSVAKKIAKSSPF